MLNQSFDRAATARHLARSPRVLVRPTLRVAVAVAALATASCGGGGPKLHPVKGSVLYQDKPAAGATVVFQPVNSTPESPMPSGVVGEDGTFTLKTHPHGDGAPSGEYVVLVTLFPPDAREMRNPQSLLPARYGTAAESPLRATVTAGNNQLEPFRLTK
jgi:hypothetical protein